jgi:OPT family oligopeptide transporter
MSPDVQPWSQKAAVPQITVRSIIAGLAIGSIVLFSNFQFGLQTGWVSMMGLPSSLLGFAVFKSLEKYLSYSFSDVENVFVQSLAVAVGTGPLAFGFVGVVPAIEKFLTPEEAGQSSPVRLSMPQLVLWSAGLSLFGVFFAVLLRRQIIVKEKLRFPSGSAAATLIAVLHKTSLHDVPISEDDLDEQDAEDGSSLQESSQETPRQEQTEDHSQVTYLQNIKVLMGSFAFSGLYTVLAYFVPVIRNLPIFGSNLAENYLWTFQPSPAYVGQGIIMGLPTVSSMLFGAFLGWAVLAPMSQHFGWATGPIDDWKTGSQGWILWISLAIMVADTIVSFLAFSARSLHSWYMTSNSEPHGYERLEESGGDSSRKHHGPEHDAPPHFLVPHKLALIGLALSLIFCIVTTRAAFGPIIPIFASIVAVILAMLLSVLGVRALGETDLNPVSGIGKISQVLFALVIPRDHPAAVLINLVAGGITEAGAQQAGDLMQDLKTGHLIGASPKAQFYGQVIGSAYSVLLSAVVYRLYDAVYDIPGSLFRIPTAVIWIDCARLVTGQGLPSHVAGFAAVFAVIFSILALIKALYTGDKHAHWTKYIPSGVAVGIGIYNTPSFTLARFIGGCISAYWLSRYPDHDSSVLLIILSSGLVLGEGVLSILSLAMTSLGVPHF